MEFEDWKRDVMDPRMKTYSEDDQYMYYLFWLCDVN